MVVGDQTPKAALRRIKRVLEGPPNRGPDDPYPFRVYSKSSLVSIDRDELLLILEDYEDLKFRREGPKSE